MRRSAHRSRDRCLSTPADAASTRPSTGSWGRPRTPRPAPPRPAPGASRSVDFALVVHRPPISCGWFVPVLPRPRGYPSWQVRPARDGRHGRVERELHRRLDRRQLRRRRDRRGAVRSAAPHDGQQRWQRAERNGRYAGVRDQTMDGPVPPCGRPTYGWAPHATNKQTNKRVANMRATGAHRRGLGRQSCVRATLHDGMAIMMGSMKRARAQALCALHAPRST
jgi:hypothetical protein